MRIRCTKVYNNGRMFESDIVFGLRIAGPFMALEFGWLALVLKFREFTHQERLEYYGFDEMHTADIFPSIYDDEWEEGEGEVIHE